MYKDNIINEVWENREAYAQHCHHDISEIIKDLQIRQRGTDRIVVDRRKSPNKANPADPKIATRSLDG